MLALDKGIFGYTVPIKGFVIAKLGIGSSSSSK